LVFHSSTITAHSTLSWPLFVSVLRLQFQPLNTAYKHTDTVELNKNCRLQCLNFHLIISHSKERCPVYTKVPSKADQLALIIIMLELEVRKRQTDRQTDRPERGSPYLANAVPKKSQPCSYVRL